MKKLLFLAVLIATFYLVVSDGMMIHFGLSQSFQYAFNIAGIFMILPGCLFILLDMYKCEEEMEERV